MLNYFPDDAEIGLESECRLGTWSEVPGISGGGYFIRGITGLISIMISLAGPKRLAPFFPQRHAQGVSFTTNTILIAMASDCLFLLYRLICVLFVISTNLT